jgi:hypothetical protein
MSTTTADERTLREVRCSECEDLIEECEACERVDCGAAICYGCLTENLGEIRPQPHDHGG